MVKLYDSVVLWSQGVKTTKSIHFVVMEQSASYMTKVRHTAVPTVCFHLCKEVESYVQGTSLEGGTGKWEGAESGWLGDRVGERLTFSS